MDSAVLWPIVLVAAVGVLIYFRRAELAKTRAELAKTRRVAQISAAAEHFSDLTARGILPIKLFAGEIPNVALRDREDVLCVFSQTTLAEPRAVRIYHGVYGGPTIRIAKGLSLRLGASRGTSESHDELRAIDIGTLLLTNKRLLFLGRQRTTSSAFEKIVGIEGHSDGLVVHREGKQKAETYLLSYGMQMTYEYDGQTLAAPVDGRLIKLVIDQAILPQENKKVSPAVASKSVAGTVALRNKQTASQTPASDTSLSNESMAPIEDQTTGETPDPAAAFAHESERARSLALEHGKFWEFLLVEELLKSRLQTLKNEYNAFDKTLLSIPKRHFTGSKFTTWMGRELEELMSSATKFTNCLSELKSSLGKPGVSGDAIKILRAVDTLFKCARNFLAVELNMCAVELSPRLTALAAPFRGITLTAIDAFEQLTDQWSARLEGLRSGSHDFQINVVLKNPSQFVERIMEEIEKARKHPELYE